jgi:signal peptidase
LEIAPVPHRATRGEWRRLTLGLLVLVPVVLLVLLPTVLGLDRFVVSDRSMDGSLGRGSVVLAREVPPTDLRVGDVVSVRSPDGASGHRVFRRIVAIDDGIATMESDSTGSKDPWAVRLDGQSYARAWLGVPWIGYPFLMGGGWLLLALAALAASVLGFAAGRRTPQKVDGPVRERLPVG